MHLEALPPLAMPCPGCTVLDTLLATLFMTHLLARFAVSPSLQKEVAWHVSRVWLVRVWFLKDMPLPFLVQLSIQLKPQVFAPGEETPIGGLYIVSRGLALYGGRVYGQGNVWGEDMILTTQHLKIKHNARAMNFLDVFTVTREELEEVADGFETAMKQLRACVVRLAVRRAIIYESYKRRQAAGEDFGTAGLPFLEKIEDSQPMVKPSAATRKSIDFRHSGQLLNDFSTSFAEPRPLSEIALRSLPAYSFPQSSSDTTTQTNSSSSWSVPGQENTLTKVPSASPIQRAFQAFLSPPSSTVEGERRPQPNQHQEAAVTTAISAAAASTLEARLAPMLEALMNGQKELLAGQRRVEKEISKQQVATQNLRKELGELDKWVKDDVMRKLRA